MSDARLNRYGEEMGELRINSKKVVLSVIDTVAISETRLAGKMVSRTEIVNRILEAFVADKIDEADLIHKAVHRQSDGSA